MKHSYLSLAHLLRSQKGVTFIELIVVIGILSVLFSIGFISVSNIRVIATNSNFASVIVSDLKTQQVKAMAGDTEGRGMNDNYGIKILSDSYVLFHGNSYNPSDTSNFYVDVETGYSLTSTFPNTTILFSEGSGEVAGFTPGQNTLTITNNSSGQSNTVMLNKYGAITDFN